MPNWGRRLRRRLLQSSGVTLSGAFNYIGQFDAAPSPAGQPPPPQPRAYNVTLTPQAAAYPRPTAQTIGINAGHSFGGSPLMFLKRLGVNGARLFGGSGGVKPRALLGGDFGLDLNGAAVAGRAGYLTAVAQARNAASSSAAARDCLQCRPTAACLLLKPPPPPVSLCGSVPQLRSVRGHDPAQNTTWAKPPLWWQYDQGALQHLLPFSSPHAPRFSYLLAHLRLPPCSSTSQRAAAADPALTLMHPHRASTPPAPPVPSSARVRSPVRRGHNGSLRQQHPQPGPGLPGRGRRAPTRSGAGDQNLAMRLLGEKQAPFSSVQPRPPHSLSWEHASSPAAGL